MKKAKIMLLAIAVIATAGAALAFKVKKKGGFDICFLKTEERPAPGQCTSTEFNSGLDAFGPGAKIYYTVTTDLNACTNIELTCPSEARLPLSQ